MENDEASRSLYEPRARETERGSNAARTALSFDEPSSSKAPRDPRRLLDPASNFPGETAKFFARENASLIPPMATLTRSKRSGDLAIREQAFRFIPNRADSSAPAFIKRTLSFRRFSGDRAEPLDQSGKPGVVTRGGRELSPSADEICAFGR